MHSPPGATVRLDASNPDYRIGNKKQEDLRYTLSYADPTGEQAIRNAANALGKKLGWDKRSDCKMLVTGEPIPSLGREMSRPKIPVHFDDQVTALLLQVLSQIAEFAPTRSGHGFRASLKKERIPDFVSLFGDSNEIEDTQQENL